MQMKFIFTTKPGVMRRANVIKIMVGLLRRPILGSEVQGGTLGTRRYKPIYILPPEHIVLKLGRGRGALLARRSRYSRNDDRLAATLFFI